MPKFAAAAVVLAIPASGRGSTESEYYLELHFKPKLNRYDKATKKYKYKLTDYCDMRGKVENEQRRGKSLENVRES